MRRKNGRCDQSSSAYTTFVQASSHFFFLCLVQATVWYLLVSKERKRKRSPCSNPHESVLMVLGFKYPKSTSSCLLLLHGISHKPFLWPLKSSCDLQRNNKCFMFPSSAAAVLVMHQFPKSYKQHLSFSYQRKTRILIFGIAKNLMNYGITDWFFGNIKLFFTLPFWRYQESHLHNATPSLKPI